MNKKFYIFNILITFLIVSSYVVLCKDEFILQNRQLQTTSTTTTNTTCPPGQFKGTNGSCSSCGTNALTCKDASNPSACNLGYYLVAASGSSTTASCSACGNNTANCTSSTVATVCFTGFYLASGACTACLDSGAATCNSSTPLTCRVGLYVAQGKCIPCLQFGASSCTNTSVISCRDGFYQNGTSTSLRCLACPQGVQTCKDAKTHYSCQPGFSLLNGTCLQCPQGALSCLTAQIALQCFDKNYLMLGSCQLCPQIGAQQCLDSKTLLSCAQGFYQSDDRLSCVSCMAGVADCSSTSIIACASNYYRQDDTNCVKCGDGVDACIDSSQPTKCSKGYTMNQTVPNAFACIQCDLGVDQCNLNNDGTTTDVICSKGFFLELVQPAPVNSTGSQNDTQDQNQTLVPTCTQCGAGSANCVSLSVNYECNPGYSWVNFNCVQCSANAKSCINQDVALQCFDGFYLNIVRPFLYQKCDSCGEGIQSCDLAPIAVNCRINWFLDSVKGACRTCSFGYVDCQNTQQASQPSDQNNNTPCALGYFLQDDQSCQPCNQFNADACSSRYAIDKCSPNFYRVSDPEGNQYCNQCQFGALTCDDRVARSCQQGSFLNSTLGVCQYCSVGAASCVNPLNATQCLDGYYRLQRQNVTQCLQCSNGTDGIQNCQSLTNVTSCSAGFFLNAGKCTKCGANANQCLSATIATFCNTGFYLLNGGCNQCGQGAVNCQYSNLTNQTSALQCQPGFYTVINLPKYWFQPTQTICQPCGDKVNTCGLDTTGTVQIFECQSGFYISAATNDTNVDDNIIKGKPAACQQCPQGASVCTQLNQSEILISNCQKGYYFDFSQNDTNKQCVQCSQGVGDCFQTYDIDQQTMQPVVDNQNKTKYYVVVLKCSNGYFQEKAYADPSDSTIKCTACDTGVDKCQRLDQDLSCLPGFYFTPNDPTQSYLQQFQFQQTVQNVPFMNLNTVPGNCQPCQNGTATCNATVSFTCSPGFFMSAGKCTSCGLVGISNCTAASTTIIFAANRCFIGYFLNANKCTQCPVGSQDCDNATFAKKCLPGYNLVVVNANATAKTAQTQSCVSCGTGVQDCSSTPVNCLLGYSIDNNNNTKCNACPTNAIDCTNTAVNRCLPGFLPSDNSCAPHDEYCSDGNYYNGQQCSPCPPGVATCQNPQAALTCKQSFFLQQWNASYISCQSCGFGVQSCYLAQVNVICKIGFFQVNNNNVCFACGPGATNCSNATFALNCSVGTYLNAGSCLKCPQNVTNCSSDKVALNCSKGFALALGACVACPANSTSCTSATNANGCLLGSILSKGLCVYCPKAQFGQGCKNNTITTNSTLIFDQCLDGWFANNDTNSTINALNPCLKCPIGASKCTAQAVTDCLPGFYNDPTNGCTNCGNGVSICLYNQTLNIVNCLDGYYYDSGAPATGGRILQEITQPSCKPCENNTATCSSSQTATSCKLGFYLYTDNSNLANFPYPVLCQPCGLNALTCESPTRALSCNPVNPPTFLDSNNNCSYCAPLATQCFSLTNSTSCLPTFYVLNGFCVPCAKGAITCSSNTTAQICLPGFYLNSTKVCNPCVGNGSACLSATLQTSCIDGFYLNVTNITNITNVSGPTLTQQGQQGAQQPPAQIFSGNCVKCPVGSLTCSSAKISKTCANGYFFFQHDASCQLCSPNALTCLSYTQTTQCQSGYFVQFIDDNVNQCAVCGINQLTCVNDRNATSCQDGFYVQDVNDDQGNYAGTYCLPCPNGGSKCDVNGNPLACAIGYFQTVDINNNTICNACGSGASNCTSQTQATQCQQGFNLTSMGSCNQCANNVAQCWDNKNATSCVRGFYLSFNATSKLGSCVQCAVNSISCTSALLQSQCIDGFFLFANSTTSTICRACNVTQGQLKCLNGTSSGALQCQPGFYLNRTGACLKCQQGESECLDLGKPTQCQPGYILQNQLQQGQNGQTVVTSCRYCGDGANQCNLKPKPFGCLNGYFFNQQIPACQKCQDINAINCDQNLKALSCLVGFNLDVSDPQSPVCTAVTVPGDI